MDHEEQPSERPNGVLAPFSMRRKKWLGRWKLHSPMLCFVVAPAILKEQLDDQLDKFIRSTSPERLMAESDAPYGRGASRYKSSVGSRDRFEKNGSNQGRPHCL